MSRIQITDNSSKELKDISESDRNDLYTIANIAIGNLSLDNPNLLIKVLKYVRSNNRRYSRLNI